MPTNPYEIAASSITTDSSVSQVICFVTSPYTSALQGK